MYAYFRYCVFVSFRPVKAAALQDVIILSEQIQIQLSFFNKHCIYKMYKPVFSVLRNNKISTIILNPMAEDCQKMLVKLYSDFYFHGLNKNLTSS